MFSDSASDQAPKAERSTGPAASSARPLVLGLVFGFVLSRVGATQYDAIHGMFMLTDLHLYGVIGAAVAVAALGFAYVRRNAIRGADGAALARAIVAKPMTPGVVWGGLLFGAGWALTGTCPGTALAQLGEGTLAGGLTIVGILAGSYLRALLDRPRAVDKALPLPAPGVTA